MKRYLRIILFFSSITILIHPSIGQTNKCSKFQLSNRKIKSSNLSTKDLNRMELFDLTYLLMDLNISNSSTEISGYVSQKGFFKSSVDSILFELHPDYIIDSIILNDKKTTYKRKETLIFIPNTFSNFEVAIYYHGSKKTLQNQFMGGSGVVNGTDMYFNTNYKVSYTQSEPFSAFEWWPSKQSLNDKIDSADLFFTTENINLVGSNGILIEKKELPNNKIKFHWQTKYPICYYLFSFSVAPYLDYSFKTFIPESNDSLLIQNFIYNDSTILNLEKNKIELTDDYIHLFSKYFGPYPFIKEKYGHCLSTIGGGMEHQTMTTLNSFDYKLVSHELAHQWWGDHVTCGSFQDIWLNEGFATYSEYLMIEKLFPTLKKSFLSEIQSRALKMKTGSVWVEDTTNVNRIFSKDLTYNKGACIIHTLRYIINNDSIFFRTLKEFQSKFAYSFASVQDFKRSIEKSSNLNFTNFFNEWYYGEGFPIYSFKSEITDSFRVYINQTTTSSKTPLFTTPLTILVGRENLPDTLIRLMITQKNTVFTYNKNLKFKYINSIDPENHIIHETENFHSINDSKNNFVVFSPNPAIKTLNINLKSTDNYTINIIDLNGKTIMETTINTDSSIPIDTLNPGLYLIKIKNEISEFTEKLIIQ